MDIVVHLVLPENWDHVKTYYAAGCIVIWKILYACCPLLAFRLVVYRIQEVLVYWIYIHGSSWSYGDTCLLHALCHVEKLQKGSLTSLICSAAVSVQTCVWNYSWSLWLIRLLLVISPMKWKHNLLQFENVTISSVNACPYRLQTVEISQLSNFQMPKWWQHIFQLQNTRDVSLLGLFQYKQACLLSS